MTIYHGKTLDSEVILYLQVFAIADIKTVGRSFENNAKLSELY